MAVAELPLLLLMLLQEPTPKPEQRLTTMSQMTEATIAGRQLQMVTLRCSISTYELSAMRWTASTPELRYWSSTTQARQQTDSR